MPIVVEGVSMSQFLEWYTSGLKFKAENCRFY
jgi:hypothetical protein